MKNKINNKKIIYSKFTKYGEYIYHTSYSPLKLLGGLPLRGNNTNNDRSERTQEENEKLQEIYSKNSKRKLKALILCNLPYGNTKFLTLTYRTPQFNETKPKNDFKNFIKRLKYHTKIQIRYIAVHEKHESYSTQTERVNSYHFHVLISNLNYVSSQIYADIWQHGFIKINKVKGEPMRMANYVAKYLTKSNTHNKYQRRFLYSKNCFRPYDIPISEVPVLEFMHSRVYNRFTGGIARCDIYKIHNNS